MTNNPNNTLDDVLDELASLPEPPNGQALRVWLSRYPEYRQDIIAFATDWMELKSGRIESHPSREDIDQVVNRTMSQVQRLLDDAERPVAIEDLVRDIRAAGHDLESFQRAIGIDRSLLTCLVGRLVRPATIRRRLVYAMAEALNRTVATVQAYLLLPPVPATAHKARGKPRPVQVDFDALVRHADLSDAEKVEWLAEPVDPGLGG